MSNRRWIIYKITSENCDKVYIGSDHRNIDVVLRYHINRAERYKRVKSFYLSSYEVLKCGGIGIEEVEVFTGKRKEDLLKRELEYIVANLDVCVNIFNPLYNKDIIGKNKKKIEGDILRRKKELEDHIISKVREKMVEGYELYDARELAKRDDIKVMDYIDDNIEEIYERWMES